jgi:hypothetical protein
MKKVTKSALAILFCLAFCVCLISCNDVEVTGIWENATYLSDTELGEGAKQVKVVISGEGQSLTLTVNTDEKTLGDALAELKLINNNNGLFDTVIGMKADYSKNQAWWKFCDADGNALMYGAFDAQINGGETFKFVYTIGF